MEHKKEFVEAINAALITFGDGRYDYLIEEPLRYVDENGCEVVYRGDEFIANVTMDSLRAMLIDIGKNADRI